jgi:hypothetical protein
MNVIDVSGIRFAVIPTDERDALSASCIMYPLLIWNEGSQFLEVHTGAQWARLAGYPGEPSQGDVLVWDSASNLFLPTSQAEPVVQRMRVYNDSTGALEVKRFYKTLTKTGTGTGGMVVAGEHTHAADTDYKIEIDSADTQSHRTATFKWSPDAGANWSDIEVPMVTGPEGAETLAPVTLQNGVQVVFSQGTYVSGDYWTFTAIGTASQLYDLKVDTSNGQVWIGHRLVLANDVNIYIEKSGDQVIFVLDAANASVWDYRQSTDEAIACWRMTILDATALELYSHRVRIPNALEFGSDALIGTPPAEERGWLYGKGVGGLVRPFWMDFAITESALAFTSELHTILTIGADGEHSLAGQVLSGVAATASQAGHATTAQITKLDGIEAAADVTDATNVEAAGAVMVSGTPGGELGGTWASPTVDATHAGSAHHDPTHTMTDIGAHSAGASKVFYSTFIGAVGEVALGALGTLLESSGTASQPRFSSLPDLAVTSAFKSDEFIGGSATSGSIGDLGWTLTVANTGTIVQSAAEAGHPGIVTLSSGVTASSAATIMIPATQAYGIFGTDLFDVTFIVKTGPSVSTGTTIYVGVTSVIASAIAHLAAVRFINGTDTYWSLITNDGLSTATTTASDITPAADTWYKFRLVRTADSVLLYIDGVLKATNTTNLPTGVMNPYVRVTNTSTAADRILLADFFSMSIPGLTR